MRSEIESFKYFYPPASLFYVLKVWHRTKSWTKYETVTSLIRIFLSSFYGDILDLNCVFTWTRSQHFYVIMTMEDLFLYWYSRLISQYVVDGEGDTVLMSTQSFLWGELSLLWLPRVVSKLTVLKYIVFRIIICGVWSRQHAYDIMTRRPLQGLKRKKHKAKNIKTLQNKQKYTHTYWKLKRFSFLVVWDFTYIRFVILDVCWGCIGDIRKSPFMGTLFWDSFFNNFSNASNNLYSLVTFWSRCISQLLFCCRILNFPSHQSVKSVNKLLQNVKIYFTFYWCPSPCACVCVLFFKYFQM